MLDRVPIGPNLITTSIKSIARSVLKHPLLTPLRKAIRPQPKIPKKGADMALMDGPAKVRYKMAHDRRPIITKFADKVAVRDYVKEMIGPEFLTELYLVTDNPEEIDLLKLPREFAFKPSHGSGAGIFVHESADPSNTLSTNIKKIKWKDKFHIHPDKVDEATLRQVGAHWLMLRYQNNNDWYEWV